MTFNSNQDFVPRGPSLSSRRPARMFKDFSTLRSMNKVVKQQAGKVAQNIYWARTDESGLTKTVVNELLVRYCKKVRVLR